MDYIEPFLSTILRLLIMTSAGFLVFKSSFSQRKLLKPMLWVGLKVMLPAFFIHSFSDAWSSAVGSSSSGSVPGWVLMLSFFGASIVMVTIQATIGWVAVKKTKFINTDNPIEMISLFAISNCGFIPIPILKPIVPPQVIIYMFFYILAFNLILWTFVAPRLERKKVKKKHPLHFRINMPLTGLILGLFIAFFDLYQHIPVPVQACLHISSNVFLDLVLVLLGGTLATIPKSSMRDYSEFKWYIILKLLLFPTAAVLIARILPLNGLSDELASALRLILVLEAAVPPGTTLMVICGIFGTREQIDFMGSGIITTYVTSIVTVPTFVLIAAYLFY